jgi:hypothetical protein
MARTCGCSWGCVQKWYPVSGVFVGLSIFLYFGFMSHAWTTAVLGLSSSVFAGLLALDMFTLHTIKVSDRFVVVCGTRYRSVSLRTIDLHRDFVHESKFRPPLLCCHCCHSHQHSWLPSFHSMIIDTVLLHTECHFLFCFVFFVNLTIAVVFSLKDGAIVPHYETYPTCGLKMSVCLVGVIGSLALFIYFLAIGTDFSHTQSR